MSVAVAIARCSSSTTDPRATWKGAWRLANQHIVGLPGGIIDLAFLCRLTLFAEQSLQFVLGGLDGPARVRAGGRACLGALTLKDA